MGGGGGKGVGEVGWVLLETKGQGRVVVHNLPSQILPSSCVVKPLRHSQ